MYKIVRDSVPIIVIDANDYWRPSPDCVEFYKDGDNGRTITAIFFPKAGDLILKEN